MCTLVLLLLSSRLFPGGKQAHGSSQGEHGEPSPLPHPDKHVLHPSYLGNTCTVDQGGTCYDVVGGQYPAEDAGGHSGSRFEPPTRLPSHENLHVLGLASSRWCLWFCRTHPRCDPAVSQNILTYCTSHPVSSILHPSVPQLKINLVPVLLIGPHHATVTVLSLASVLATDDHSVTQLELVHLIYHSPYANLPQHIQ